MKFKGVIVLFTLFLYYTFFLTYCVKNNYSNTLEETSNLKKISKNVGFLSNNKNLKNNFKLNKKFNPQALVKDAVKNFIENNNNQDTKLINSLNNHSIKGYNPALVDKWSKLFNNNIPKEPCNSNNYLKQKTPKKISDAFLDDKVPQAKPDIWTIQKFGNGDASYFFDYVDICFRKDIVNEFKEMFNKVKSFPYNEELDPYSPLKLLAGYNSLGFEDRINQFIFEKNDENNKQQALKVIEEITNSTFKADLYNSGIAMPQFDQIFSNFKWDLPKHNKPENIGYYEFNKFDINGDGRLSPREFILFAIRYNKDYYGKLSKGTKDYVFSDIIDNYLVPFFYYADCDNDSLITAQNIWDSSLELKCASSQNGYKLNSCPSDPYDFNIDYKTNSCSDIVLNNETLYDGRLTLSEWITGILMGYWDRQTTNNSIEEGDNNNMKELRWKNNGTVDIECENQKKFKKSTN